MSSEEKRIPYSVYLTPKADAVLKGYVKGSGYLSASRTVEEMILAFDFIYKSVAELGKSLNVPLDQQPQEQQARTLWALFTLFSSIQNATERLKWADAHAGGDTNADSP
jgi:hypothetical protein